MSFAALRTSRRLRTCRSLPARASAPVRKCRTHDIERHSGNSRTCRDPPVGPTLFATNAGERYSGSGENRHMNRFKLCRHALSISAAVLPQVDERINREQSHFYYD